jgi:hypothetical protein
MLKTEVQAQFDYLVAKVLWPLFKSQGYQKIGNNFRHYNSCGWGKIVNIQKSAFGDRHHISFTVNVGLYLAEAEHIWTGRTSQEKFLEPHCLIRARIGRLNKSNQDWYDLTEQTVIKTLYKQVEGDIVTYVLPYLDKMESLEAIIGYLLQKRQPNSAQAISTVFACGYQQEARQWLADELATTTSRAHRQQMESIRSALA